MRSRRSPPAGAGSLNVAILGLGLIGGSIGLALHAGEDRLPAEEGGSPVGSGGSPVGSGGWPMGSGRSPAGSGESPLHVVGFDPDEQTLEAALGIGAIDEAAASASSALAKADVAFVAGPVGTLAQTVRLALRDAPANCVITDVGSTKRSLMAELASEAGMKRFVGGHPLAGAEQGGIAHARADLFAGAAWCLVPPRDAEATSDSEATSGAMAIGEGVAPCADPASATACAEAHRRLATLIEGFGARVVEIDAKSHDRLMAHISHLPHVLANILVVGLADYSQRERGLAAAGPSFRDATRVAGASTAIWGDIYLSNADMLIDAIDEAIASLGEVRAILSTQDEQALRAWNERARTARQSLLA